MTEVKEGRSEEPSPAPVLTPWTWTSSLRRSEEINSSPSRRAPTALQSGCRPAVSPLWAVQANAGR